MKKHKRNNYSFLKQAVRSGLILFFVGLITLSLYPGKPKLGMKFNDFMTADVLRPTLTIDGRTTNIRKPNPSVRMIALKFAQEEYFRSAPEEVDCSLPVNEDSTAPELIYDALALNAEFDLNVDPGEVFPLIIKLKNNGTAPWFSESSNCAQSKIHLGTSSPLDHANPFSTEFETLSSGWISSNRLQMDEPRVDPGEIGTFIFWNKAPDTEGIYREYMKAVIEGVKWLETPEIKTTFYVGEFSSEEIEKLTKYLLPDASSNTANIDFDAERHVDINLSTQTMQFYVGETLVREYRVSSGKAKTPTPTGTFHILYKQTLRVGGEWPHYRMPYWQAFSKWGHGLHSLPYLANDGGSFWKEARSHIGIPVSHGCVRMWDENAEELYGFTEVGDRVVIHY